MKPRDIVLEQIRHHETAPVPYTLWFEKDVDDRLNQYFGGNVWRKKIIPYICRCGYIDESPREKIDAIHFRGAYGSVWQTGTDQQPDILVKPALNAPSFEGYTFPSAGLFLNNDAKSKTRKCVADTADSFTIACVGICLWDAWNIRGFETTMMDCIAEEDFYAELLDRLTDLTISLVNAGADIPADAILMGDDWGYQNGVMLGPERWRRFYKPRYARIFEAIHAQGKFAVMHSCGSVADIMGDIIEIGLDVLESVQPEAAGMNPYALKQAWGDKITFWGCLGSQSTIPFSTPAQIRQEIRRLRSEMGKRGGFILAPAKPLRSDTPTENAVAIVEEFLAG